MKYNPRLFKGLHNAELAGKEAAKLGLEVTNCPYKRRGFSGLYRKAWLSGYKNEKDDIKYKAIIKNG